MVTSTRVGSAEPGTNRIDWLVYLVILIQGCVYWIYCQRLEDVAPDSSAYQGLARSLRELGTYEFNFAPHIQYPPGVPLIVAGIVRLFGDEFVALLRAMAVAGVLGLLATYEFLKQEQGRAVAATAALLLGASTYFFTFATIVLNADLPYLATSIAALLIGKRLEAPARSLSHALTLSLLFALMLLAAVLVRSVGVTLIGGYCLWLALSFLLRVRRIPPTQLLGFGIPIALAIAWQVVWWLYVHRVESQALPAWGGAYAEQFWLLDPRRPELGMASYADILARIPGKLVQHSAHLFELASGSQWIDQLWYSPFVLLPMVSVGWGFLESAYHRRSAVECYFLLYMIVYSLWPFEVGARFVLPIFPIAFLYAWRATVRAATIASQRPSAFALCGMTAGIVLSVASLAPRFGVDSQLSLQARTAPVFWLLASAAAGTLWYTGARRSRPLVRLVYLPRRRISSRVVSTTGLLVVAALVLKGFVYAHALGIQTSERLASSYFVHSASVEAAKWIKMHARQTDVVMAQQLPVVHYVSGHQIVPFPPTADAERIMNDIRNRHVKFLVVITSDVGSHVLPPELTRLQALRQAHGDILLLVNQGPGYEIYRTTNGDDR